MNAGERKMDPLATRRPSSRARLVLASLAMLMLFSCLGLMASGVYLWARQAGALSRWRSLGTPLGRGTEIVTGDTDVVYVATAAGRVYACDRSKAEPTEDCWKETSQPLRIDPETEFDHPLFQKDVAPPSGTVMDVLNVTLWYVEGAYETRYVLLQDGSVWMWRYDVNAYVSMFIWVFGALAGLALGILGMAVLWVRAGVTAMLLRRSRN